MFDVCFVVSHFISREKCLHYIVADLVDFQRQGRYSNIIIFPFVIGSVFFVCCDGSLDAQLRPWQPQGEGLHEGPMKLLSNNPGAVGWLLLNNRRVSEDKNHKINDHKFLEKITLPETNSHLSETFGW